VGLLLLKFCAGIKWNDTVLTRSLGLLVILLLILFGFATVIIILGLIFTPIFERQERQMIKSNKIREDSEIGKMRYSDGWSVSQGFTLFDEEYRISVLFECVGQDEDITRNQKNAYKEFNLNHEKLQSQLEQKLEEEEFSDTFIPSQLIISKDGVYKLIGEDGTSDDSGFEFLVTFDPLEIVLQEEILQMLELNRDSVCAADDVFSHNAVIRIEQTDCNEELILDISKRYLPKMDGAAWDCIINDVLIAKVQGDFSRVEIIAVFAFDTYDYAAQNKMYFKYHSTPRQ
jgi:hypothetical protein